MIKSPILGDIRALVSLDNFPDLQADYDIDIQND